MISYAQNFEDVLLWRLLKEVPNGFYVDVGAFHPEIDSVTKWFYDQGWRGLNIEPVPSSFEVLAAAREHDTNVQAAAGSKHGHRQMWVPHGSAGLASLLDAAPLSRTDGDLIEVEVRTLNELLAPFGSQPIHFLKIDAEGSEREVLLGLDLALYRPWVIVIEATAPQTQKLVSPDWNALLVDAGYRKTYFDGLNEFYLWREQAHFADRLTTPPNVFDQFVPAALVRTQSCRDRLQGLLNDARWTVDRQRQQLARCEREIRRYAALLGAVRDDMALLAATERELRQQNDDLISAKSDGARS